MNYADTATEILEIRRRLNRLPQYSEIFNFIRGEMVVLEYLVNAEKDVYPKQLSAFLKVSTARIAAILKSMEDKKWITRKKDPDDNRKVIIELTEKGREVCNQKRDKTLGATIEMLEQLGEEDAGEFLRLYRRIDDFS